MKKVLITGAKGLTGSACVELFTKKGWEVVGIDNNMREYLFGLGDLDLEAVDIRDENAINKIFETFKPDAIIHTAAQPSHDWSQKDPLMDFDINARATLVLLEAMRKYTPNAVFVHVSTDKVYGENMSYQVHEEKFRWEPIYPDDRNGYKEDLGLDFTMRSPFGCSKLASDVYAQEYARYFGLKVGIFRPGCITGKMHKGAELHGFLAYLVKCIKESKTYKIFGYKGKQVRDQIHSMDLANAFYHFVKNPHPGEVYNIGGGPDRSVSILEAISLIEQETGKKAVIDYVEEPRKGDRIWDIHDVSKFRRHYPEWKYEYSLIDIIKDVCKN